MEGKVSYLEIESSPTQSVKLKLARQGIQGAGHLRRGQSHLPRRSVLLDGSYSEQAVNRAIDALKPAKRTIRGCNGALTSIVLEGRRLTKALVNLGRHLGLTSTLWSFRQISPIRKDGPKTVRSTAALRPISLATEMASVQDALWVARNARQLEDFCGPSQLGGVDDPLCLVVALILHAQMRAFHGLCTWCALADLRWAFDVANIPGMKLVAFLAGVTGLDWLLLDDFLDVDSPCVALHGLLSAAFTLACGTAQGRRFSVGVFNGLLRWLADLAHEVEPQGCVACPPPFRRRILMAVDATWPAQDKFTPSQWHQSSLAALDRIKALARDEQAPWPRTQSEFCEVAKRMPAHADRVALVEALGHGSLGPLQFVDDLTVPCASPGAARGVCSSEPQSACSRYALAVKAEFKYAKIMPMLDSPDPQVLGCECIFRRVLLGVLVDSASPSNPCSLPFCREGAHYFSNYSTQRRRVCSPYLSWQRRCRSG